MLRVTAQGIEELKNILEEMSCKGCGHEHAGDTPSQGECGGCGHEPVADVHEHSECGGCGCGVHAPGECTSEELALRLIVMGDRGFGLVMDIPRNGDQIIERDGVKLLLIGHELIDSVRGLVLDCVDVPGGRALTFTPGQA
jgi:hypothetical protein